MSIKQTINAIRSAIARCKATERELYEELVAESEGWKMRLQELYDEAGQDEAECEDE